MPDGQLDRLVPPIAANMRYVVAGALTVGVEFRELNARVIEQNYGDDPDAMRFFATMMDVDDIGITLHVYSTDDMVERLRFDAFGDNPHYHYIRPDGSHQVVRYDADACGEMIPWAVQALHDRAPEMLREAGATELAARLDVTELRAALPGITAIAREMLEHRAPG